FRDAAGEWDESLVVELQAEGVSQSDAEAIRRGVWFVLAGYTHEAGYLKTTGVVNDQATNDLIASHSDAVTTGINRFIEAHQSAMAAMDDLVWGDKGLVWWFNMHTDNSTRFSNEVSNMLDATRLFVEEYFHDEVYDAIKEKRERGLTLTDREAVYYESMDHNYTTWTQRKVLLSQFWISLSTKSFEQHRDIMEKVSQQHPGYQMLDLYTGHNLIKPSKDTSWMIFDRNMRSRFNTWLDVGNLIPVGEAYWFPYLFAEIGRDLSVVQNLFCLWGRDRHSSLHHKMGLFAETGWSQTVQPSADNMGSLTLYGKAGWVMDLARGHYTPALRSAATNMVVGMPLDRASDLSSSPTGKDQAVTSSPVVEKKSFIRRGQDADKRLSTLELSMFFLRKTWAVLGLSSYIIINLVFDVDPWFGLPLKWLFVGFSFISIFAINIPTLLYKIQKPDNERDQPRSGAMQLLVLIVKHAIHWFGGTIPMYKLANEREGLADTADFPPTQRFGWNQHLPWKVVLGDPRNRIAMELAARMILLILFLMRFHPLLWFASAITYLSMVFIWAFHAEAFNRGTSILPSWYEAGKNLQGYAVALRGPGGRLVHATGSFIRLFVKTLDVIGFGIWSQAIVTKDWVKQFMKSYPWLLVLIPLMVASLWNIIIPSSLFYYIVLAHPLLIQLRSSYIARRVQKRYRILMDFCQQLKSENSYKIFRGGADEIASEAGLATGTYFYMALEEIVREGHIVADLSRNINGSTRMEDVLYFKFIPTPQEYLEIMPYSGFSEPEKRGILDRIIASPRTYVIIAKIAFLLFVGAYSLIVPSAIIGVPAAKIAIYALASIGLLPIPIYFIIIPVGRLLYGLFSRGVPVEDDELISAERQSNQNGDGVGADESIYIGRLKVIEEIELSLDKRYWQKCYRVTDGEKEYIVRYYITDLSSGGFGAGPLVLAAEDSVQMELLIPEGLKTIWSGYIQVDQPKGRARFLWQTPEFKYSADVRELTHLKEATRFQLNNVEVLVIVEEVVTDTETLGEVSLEEGSSPAASSPIDESNIESLKWEQDIPISYDEDTRPAILAAINEGRFFALDNIVDANIATVFRGTSQEIASRFHDSIIDPAPGALDAMERTLRSPPLLKRLRSSFFFLQYVIRRLNDEQVASRRFVIILEPGFETTAVDPTIVYKGDFKQDKFASLLSHAGQKTNNIYLGLNTLEFVQASQYHIPGLVAIIRHENQNIYHGYHLSPTGRNRDLIYGLWQDLFVFVDYQNQILSNNPVRPENARAQLILREVISHLNMYELIGELEGSAISFSANRNMRVVMRPASGQEEQAKVLYQHGINDGLPYPDSGECVSFEGCELPSDSKRFAGDIVGILEGYKHEIDTPDFESEEVSHNFVTDGGLKTRMFAFTIQRVFQGAYRMFNRIFLDISFLSQQTILAQCPGMGRGYTLLGGSDNIVSPGALAAGGKPLADLPKDADIVFFGAGTRVPVPEDMGALKEFNDGLEQERRRML
ncbi:hypothetical protein ACFL96_18190, partial [Thermoproteota archaeon]